MKKIKINYLSTIPKIPEHPVYKIYLQVLVDTIKVLELSYIFVQAYEQVCTKILPRTKHLFLKQRTHHYHVTIYKTEKELFQITKFIKDTKRRDSFQIQLKQGISKIVYLYIGT